MYCFRRFAFEEAGAMGRRKLKPCWGVEAAEVWGEMEALKKLSGGGQGAELPKLAVDSAGQTNVRLTDKWRVCCKKTKDQSAGSGGLTSSRRSSVDARAAAPCVAGRTGAVHKYECARLPDWPTYGRPRYQQRGRTNEGFRRVQEKSRAQGCSAGWRWWIRVRGQHLHRHGHAEA